MADKPLHLVNGRIKEVEATVVSTGAGNAGDLAALGADGRLDPTVMPAGFGANTDSLTASENLTSNDFVNIWDDSGTIKVRKADNSNGRIAHGFVLAGVTSGNAATVYGIGELNSGGSFTAGAVTYLGTSGGVTTTSPTGSGVIVQRLGVPKSATAMRFVPGEPVELA